MGVQSKKTKSEKATHSMPTKLDHDDDSAVHEKMKGKAGATDTKQTKKEKTDSERSKLGKRGKLGKSGTALKGTKGKVETAKPKLKAVEEAGPNINDDTPSDILDPIGDDMPDEPVLESLDAVSNRIGKKEKKEERTEKELVDDDEAEKVILEGQETATNNKEKKETKDSTEESKLEKRKERGTKGTKENAPIVVPQTGDDDYPVDPWNQPGPATESLDAVSNHIGKKEKKEERTEKELVDDDEAEKIILEGQETATNNKEKKETKDSTAESKLEKRK